MNKEKKDNIIGLIYAILLLGFFGSSMAVIWGLFLNINQLMRYGGLFFFTLLLTFIVTVFVINVIED